MVDFFKKFARYLSVSSIIFIHLVRFFHSGDNQAMIVQIDPLDVCLVAY